MRLALFDLDHTLLPIDSDYAWGQFTTTLGWVEPVAFAAQNTAFYEQYKACCLDIDAYIRFATAAFVARGPEKSAQAHVRFMAQVIEPNIRPAALALLAQHRAAGDEIVIVTATNAFITQPIATRLGVSELIALELQRDAAGWYTGAIEGTPSVQAGKVTRVLAWLADRGLSWRDVTHSSFYSDSMNDLPLLELVDRAVATNPDPKLRALAQQRGWSVLDLFAGQP